jgi:multidrug efflux system membrane fusion protein
MNRPAYLLPLALAFALLGACDRGPAPSTGPRPARAFRVGVTPVATRPLSYAVEAVGSLEAYDVVSVPARVPGVLESLDFDEGDAVGTDKVLAVVDGQRYVLELEQAAASLGKAEATVESAKARTGQAEAVLKEAESNLARRKGLREKNPGWVTEEEVSALETAAARARASVEEARAGERESAALVEVAKSLRAMARKNLEDARVRSPIAGTVERRRASVGQYVREGDPIATLVDVSRLRVRFRVSESESVRLVKGQPATFRVAAFPGRDFDCAIVHVNASADPATRMVECLAAVKDPPAALRPGFFASVSVTVAREGEAIVIPVEAILPTEKGFTAFTVVDGKAASRKLRLGLHTRDGGVEVLEGLARGDVLVTAGAQILVDGVKVEIVQAAPAAPEKAGGKE